jgi:hypothetical protein
MAQIEEITGTGHPVSATQEKPAGQPPPGTTEPAFMEESHDFSLVLGDPLQLFRRSHLAEDHLELLHRRLLVITLVAWLPLLLLAALGSSAGVHVRFHAHY